MLLLGTNLTLNNCGSETANNNSQDENTGSKMGVHVILVVKASVAVASYAAKIVSNKLQ